MARWGLLRAHLGRTGPVRRGRDRRLRVSRRLRPLQDGLPVGLLDRFRYRSRASSVPEIPSPVSLAVDEPTNRPGDPASGQAAG
ncbi:hypothetical protein ABZY14_36480 [Streptomyces sp. NPDC006617]|uniref:hypothetical protein n=1 Tax=Streptomyces sp. NPDC006617 TaxID=3155354 RepID=UPI0033AC2F00